MLCGLVGKKAVNLLANIFFFQGDTGKSLLEALILASTNPQYDKRLFIDLTVQYMKTTSSEHVVYINCFFVFVLTLKTGKSMNNLLSYCGLGDARVTASEKDLPVIVFILYIRYCLLYHMELKMVSKKNKSYSFLEGGSISFFQILLALVCGL